MNRDKVQGQPDDGNPGGRTVGAHVPAGLFACAVVTLIATSTTSVLADTKIYDLSALRVWCLSQGSRQMSLWRRFRARPGITVDWRILNLIKRLAGLDSCSHEGGVFIQPDRSIKIRSGRAPAVDSRDRYPAWREEPLRHERERCLGAKHLRYLLHMFHGNIRLALAAYNAGERKVDLYGQIPPYKETQDYVEKVIGDYRSYRQDGWIMPVTVADRHEGRLY